MLTSTMVSAARFGAPLRRVALGFGILSCTLVAITLAQVDRPAGLATSEPISYFIDDGLPDSGYRPGDNQLAVWALEDWSRASQARLRFRRVDTEESALIRVRWVPAGQGQYGETRSIVVDGRRGAEVFIRPNTEALGPGIAASARADSLFRDTLVYLTCLHEFGHAIGLSHTATYEDIMFYFGYGGDIVNFFQRYRRKLDARDDIARVSGLSPGDLGRLIEIYR
jgi:hypothetical protein